MAHLYRAGSKARNLAKFKRKYGSKKGVKVYGAVVGKVKRERRAKRQGFHF